MDLAAFILAAAGGAVIGAVACGAWWYDAGKRDGYERAYHDAWLEAEKANQFLYEEEASSQEEWQRQIEPLVADVRAAAARG